MEPYSPYNEPLETSLDLTPLIDTVFMLLVFFIMATTFAKPVLEVVLQNAEGAAIQEVKTEPLVITITENGLFYLGDLAVSLDDLEKIVVAGDKEQGIIFNVDKKAPFGPFVQTIELAKKYGKESFAINTAGKEKTP